MAAPGAGYRKAMDPLMTALIVSMMAAIWLLSTGVIRVLAWRAGTDRTDGMLGVAGLALSLGGVALIACLILGVAVTR